MYSLAGTLYHAITGTVPFEAPTVEAVVAAHIHTPLTPPNQVAPEISPATSDALVRAMAKNPGERFQSYDEFIMAMEAARSQLLVSQLRGQAAGGGAASVGRQGRSWWRR
jgi:serine/threonine-protein kinase